MKCFIDVETTGFNHWRDSILQLAAVITDDKLNVIGTFNEFARPYTIRNWNTEAESIHGISSERASNFDTQFSLVNNFSLFLDNLKEPGVRAYEFLDYSVGKFDFKFIKTMFFHQGVYYDFYKHFSDNKYKSVLTMAKKDNNNYKSNKLSDVCDWHNISLTHHEASSDTRATLELYKIFNKTI